MEIDPWLVYGKNNNVTITCDIVVPITISGVCKIVAIKRKYNPYKGFFALPGGHLDDSENKHEEIIECAQRELFEEINLKANLEDLTFINLYHRIKRDTRGRYITFAYLYNKSLTEIDLKYLKAKDDAESLHFPCISDPDVEFAFDHRIIVTDAIKKMNGETISHGLDINKPGFSGANI